MVEPEGALLAVVLPDHPSLQRCRLRSPGIELLQRVVSLPPLEEGCCICRVGLVLRLSCSAVGLEGCEGLPAHLGRCESTAGGEETFAALEMHPLLPPAELCCDGVGLEVLWDHGRHVIAESVIVQDLEWQPPCCSSKAGAARRCESDCNANVVSWIACCLHEAVTCGADPRLQLLRQEPPIEPGC